MFQSILAGTLRGLAAAERRLGLDSQCVSLYPATHSTEPVDVRIGRTPWEREGQRTRLLLEAIRSADEVHYHFGETLLMPRRHPTFLAGKQSGVAELAIRALACVLWGGRCRNPRSSKKTRVSLLRRRHSPEGVQSLQLRNQHSQ